MGTPFDVGAALRLPWRAACEASVLLYRSLAGGLNGVGAALVRIHALSRQRHDLVDLSDRMLKDIGLSRSDAEREWRRPFWTE